MTENFENVEKGSISNASNISKTISEEFLSHIKERRKISKKKMFRSNKRRLSGGADPESSAAEQASAKEEPDELQSEVSADVVSYPEPPPGSPTAKNDVHLAPTGDPRVDEELECVLHNLEEASKALTSVGENLEHEFKLFLIEFMARSRKWTSHVNSKIEWAKRDLMELHKELASRISALEDSRRESADLRVKLENSETAKSLAQKSLTETLKIGPRMDADPSLHGLSAARSIQLGQAGIDPSLLSPRTASQMHLEGSATAMRAEEERLKNCCAELEAEIIELKKENEKIVKERAEYENAIQRALLKGVSSLNVEALKVLRCTPIPSCCPPSTTIEPVATKTSRDCTSPSNGAKSPTGGVRNNCLNALHAGSRETLNNVTRKPCPGSPERSERKHRKSRDNNMLLLLHQKDAENFGIQTTSCCENANKKSTICSGGNCGNKYGRNNYMC